MEKDGHTKPRQEVAFLIFVAQVKSGTAKKTLDTRTLSLDSKRAFHGGGIWGLSCEVAVWKTWDSDWDGEGEGEEDRTVGGPPRSSQSLGALLSAGRPSRCAMCPFWIRLFIWGFSPGVG